MLELKPPPKTPIQVRWFFLLIAAVFLFLGFVHTDDPSSLALGIMGGAMLCLAVLG